MPRSTRTAPRVAEADQIPVIRPFSSLDIEGGVSPRHPRAVPSVAVTCSTRGCFKRPLHKGLCQYHYRLGLRLSKPPCAVPGCHRRSRDAGVCQGHRQNGGKPLRTIRPRGPRRQRAWGQLWLEARTVKWLAKEAKKRGLPPTGLMADLLDELARRA